MIIRVGPKSNGQGPNKRQTEGRQDTQTLPAGHIKMEQRLEWYLYKPRNTKYANRQQNSERKVRALPQGARPANT